MDDPISTIFGMKIGSDNWNKIEFAEKTCAFPEYQESARQISTF